jgi:hypothetical protein
MVMAKKTTVIEYTIKDFLSLLDIMIPSQARTKIEFEAYTHIADFSAVAENTDGVVIRLEWTEED